jgi:hypothetical protein
VAVLAPSIPLWQVAEEEGVHGGCEICPDLFAEQEQQDRELNHHLRTFSPSQQYRVVAPAGVEFRIHMPDKPKKMPQAWQMLCDS